MFLLIILFIHKIVDKNYNSDKLNCNIIITNKLLFKNCDLNKVNNAN